MEQDTNLNFYISQFRRMFKRIIIIYVLIIACLLYVLWQLSSLKEPVYYAASESGQLRKLEPYNVQQISKWARQLKNQANQS